MHIEYPAGIPVQTVLNIVTPYDIPIGSRGYTITVLSGTASIQVLGAAAYSVPAGFSLNDNATLLKKITITPAAASSVFVGYLPKG